MIFHDPSTKTIGLSLVPEIVTGLDLSPAPVSVGEVLEGAVVKRVDPKIGVLLSLPANKGHAYATLSRLSDEPSDRVDKKFRVCLLVWVGGGH